MLTPRLAPPPPQLCHLLTLWDTGRIDVLAVNSAAGNTPAIDPTPLSNLHPYNITSPPPPPPPPPMDYD